MRKEKYAVEILQAVAGGQKTRTMAAEAIDNISRTQSVFAVRTIQNSELLIGTLRKMLEEKFSPFNPSCAIRRIDSDDGAAVGRVTDRLEMALNSGGARIIVITHQTLAEFDLWDRYAKGRVLYIDELPQPLAMASKTFADEELKAINPSIGVDDVDALKTNPGVIKSGAVQLHENDLAEDSVWCSETSSLWRVLSTADERCISIDSVNQGERLQIGVVQESPVFDRIKHFDKVRLATMLFDGSLFELIGKAKGIEFKSYGWPNHGKQFTHDDKVTIYPLSDDEGLASKYKLNAEDDAGSTLFERLIQRALVIPAFENPPLKVLLYINKDQARSPRLRVLEKLGVRDKFDLLPFDCHGHHQWQQEGRTRFVLILTNRWNPNYDAVGEQLCLRLGIDFGEFKRAYVVSQMLEPTAQAATRGITRSDKPNSEGTHIAVVDRAIAEWLKVNVFPKATICTSYMLKAKPKVYKSWRARFNESHGNAESVWIDRNMNKINEYYRRVLDQNNADHVTLVELYLADNYSPRQRRAA